MCILGSRSCIVSPMPLLRWATVMSTETFRTLVIWPFLLYLCVLGAVGNGEKINKLVNVRGSEVGDSTYL